MFCWSHSRALVLLHHQYRFYLRTDPPNFDWHNSNHGSKGGTWRSTINCRWWLRNNSNAADIWILPGILEQPIRDDAYMHRLAKAANRDQYLERAKLRFDHMNIPSNRLYSELDFQWRFRVPHIIFHLICECLIDKNIFVRRGDVIGKKWTDSIRQIITALWILAYVKSCDELNELAETSDTSLRKKLLLFSRQNYFTVRFRIPPESQWTRLEAHTHDQLLPQFPWMCRVMELSTLRFAQLSCCMDRTVQMEEEKTNYDSRSIFGWRALDLGGKFWKRRDPKPSEHRTHIVNSGVHLEWKFTLRTWVCRKQKKEVSALLFDRRNLP